MIGQRNMLCGMHVHVELPDPDERVDVMTRMLPYLPLFIALATSSPFWRSRPTGLKGYRLAAYDELPRTGVPELFKTKEEFDAYVEALVKAGVMQDSSYIWWAIRPSLKHPTLELRAPDVPARWSTIRSPSPRSMAFAGAPAHPQSVAQLATSTRCRARSWSRTSGARSATACTARFVAANGGAVTVAEMLEQRARGDREDAEALGCLAEVRHCRTIVGAGTSADARSRCSKRTAAEKPRPMRCGGHGLAGDRDAAVAQAAPRSPARQRGLHDKAAGARIDHAERAQREQRQRLHRLARLRRVVAGVRARAARSALRAARRPAPAPPGRVLLGQMPACHRGVDAGLRTRSASAWR